MEFSNLKTEKKIKLYAKIKNEVKNNGVAQFLAYKNEYVNFLILAQYISKNNRETLCQNNINYIESSGNCYIEKKGLWPAITIWAAKVCSIEGLVLLKLFANHDGPQRTKDLIDIKLIVKLYFDLFSEEVYEIHFDLINLHDTHDVVCISKICAHFIGRKFKMILQKDELLLKRKMENLN